MKYCAGLLAAVLCLSAAPSSAQEDVEGSFDPPGLSRFPGGWIEFFSTRENLRGHQFITGPVEKIRRDVRIEQSVRVPGDLARATYRIPDEVPPSEVMAHYRGLIKTLSGQVLYECDGADCGRSTVWASNVFKIPELAAPVGSQSYLAADIPNMVSGDAEEGDGSRLVAVYVVQRGNRRIYAHVEVLTTAKPVGFDSNRDLATELARWGWFVIEGIEPDQGGGLDDEDLAVLDEIQGALRSFARETLYVVCHLDGSADVQTLMARSTDCARAAAQRLAAGGLKTEPFGAGSLLPRKGLPERRIELVLPYRDGR